MRIHLLQVTMELVKPESNPDSVPVLWSYPLCFGPFTVKDGGLRRYLSRLIVVLSTQSHSHNLHPGAPDPKLHFPT